MDWILITRDHFVMSSLIFFLRFCTVEQSIVRSIVTDDYNIYSVTATSTYIMVQRMFVIMLIIHPRISQAEKNK